MTTTPRDESRCVVCDAPSGLSRADLDQLRQGPTRPVLLVCRPCVAALWATHAPDALRLQARHQAAISRGD